MFNKLKNLIFEEEDIIEEDEDTLEDSYESAPVVKTAKPKAAKKAEKPVIEDNYYEEPKPVSKTIKTAPAVEPTETYVPKSKPASKPQQHIDNVKLDNLRTYSAPSETQETKPASQPKSSLGIQVDDVDTYKPLNSSAQKAAMASQRTSRPKPAATVASKTNKNVAKVETNSTYERRPVISPIFGLSEKDVQASMNSTLVPKNNKEAEKDDIISPIYGNAIRTPYQQPEVKETYEPTAGLKEIDDYQQITETHDVYQEEKEADDVPVFSLDDILASRDEQDKKIAAKEPKENRTRVVNSRNYSLFDDED